MGTESRKQPATSGKNSSPNYAQRLAARLTIEEAIMGATRMLSAYPETAKDCSREYLMTLAQTLCQYPREVATQACSPIHGVPRQFKSFRPTAGQIAEWCEERTEPIWERAKLEVPALPAPTISETELAAGKAHIDKVLAKFKESNRVLKKSWFDKLEVQELEHRFPGISK